MRKFQFKYIFIIFIILGLSMPIFARAPVVINGLMKDNTKEASMGGDLNSLASGYDSFLYNPAGINFRSDRYDLLSFHKKHPWELTILGVDFAEYGNFSKALSLGDKMFDDINKITSDYNKQNYSDILDVLGDIQNSFPDALKFGLSSNVAISWVGYHFGTALIVNAGLFDQLNTDIPDALTKGINPYDFSPSSLNNIRLLELLGKNSGTAQFYLSYAYPLKLKQWKISIGGSFHTGYNVFLQPYNDKGPIDDSFIRTQDFPDNFTYAQLENLKNNPGELEKYLDTNNLPTNFSILGGVNLGFDLGTLIKIHGLGLGLSFLNIGNIPLLDVKELKLLGEDTDGNSTLLNHQFVIPTVFNVGVSYQIPWKLFKVPFMEKWLDIQAHVDFQIPFDSQYLAAMQFQDYLHTGLQLKLFRLLNFRVGYQNRGYALGAGFMLYFMSFDFSYNHDHVLSRDYYTNSLHFNLTFFA